jgi:hypothetical protein
VAAARQLDVVRREGWRNAARRIVRVLRGRTAPSIMYDAWFREQARTARESRDIPADLARLSYRPRISILTPVYNTPPDLLRAMVDSVRAQWYPDWQLCLADDASPKAETRAALDAVDGSDPRIRVIRQPVNGGISAATNAALDAADGEFVALLDHDDEIPPTRCSKSSSSSIAIATPTWSIPTRTSSNSTARTSSRSSSRTGRPNTSIRRCSSGI